MNGRRLLLTLSWLWPVILIVYLVWGGLTQTGLYYWVGTLQVDRFGSYAPALTGIVPGLLLALPAHWFLGGEARRQRAAPPDPAARARTLRLASFLLCGLGVVALAVALASFLAAQRFPDGAESAMPFDPAALGNGRAPAYKVSIAGAVDASARTSVSDGSRFSASTTTYAGFRPAGVAEDGAPLRLFVESRAGPGPGVPYLGKDETGYLIENGLPPLILYALERQAIRIASPHYLLRTGSGALRNPYYVGTALGVFFFCLLVGIGSLLLILPMRGGPGGGGLAGRR